MSDKLREEFEQYCHKEELGMTGSDCTGEYYNPVIEMLWHCWESSRAKDKDAARYRWWRDIGRHNYGMAVVLGTPCSKEVFDEKTDEAMKCK